MAEVLSSMKSVFCCAATSRGSRLFLGLGLVGVLLVAAFGAGMLSAKILGPTRFESKGFVVEKEVVVKGTPDEVFDAFTGDVKPWWDHSFSKTPHAMVIEPEVGGRFYELFDEEGNGVVHASVTFVDRGKKLIFKGPLGFQGTSALEMVHVFTFEAEGESTRIRVQVRGVGEVADGVPEAIDGVWNHFLVERFKAFVETRK